MEVRQCKDVALHKQHRWVYNNREVTCFGVTQRKAVHLVRVSYYQFQCISCGGFTRYPPRDRPITEVECGFCGSVFRVGWASRRDLGAGSPGYIAPRRARIRAFCGHLAPTDGNSRAVL